ncbi:MAG: alpha/beta hydrolase [Anaerolineales bacterium]
MIDSLRPGSEPFFLPGSSTGVLLLHGFTGAPSDMRPLAEALHADGLTVHGVRLAHHGTQAEDMNRAHWRDWAASALDGYHLLRAQCERVFVMGLSMGGMLTLRLAAQLPLAGVVAMSTPSLLFYQRSGWRPHFAGALSAIFRYVIKNDVAHGVQYGGSYPVFPTAAVGQFYALLKDTDPLLPNVSVPVLLIHSHGDDFIPGESMPYLYERLSNAPNDMFWLQTSGHVITLDREQPQLFARIRDFVRAHSLTPHP